MKELFYGYSAPSEDQYKLLWEEGLIVLDTNVLLDLYRLPTRARDELIAVLSSLKERLWIPHQVALEFHRKRLSVISAERKSTDDALKMLGEMVDTVKNKFTSLQIEKRGLDVDPAPLLTKLEEAKEELISAIRKVQDGQVDISSADIVRDKLYDLLEGRVGKGPQSQAELNVLVEQGEDRFIKKIPPGYMDSDKELNATEATFIFDHIEYQRKFGDLILWRQLLEHVKASSCKSVLMVTREKKEDWWYIGHGRTIGPHPELMREMHRTGGVDLFWMYSSVQFVEHAKIYKSATVSDNSLNELKSVATSYMEERYLDDRQGHHFWAGTTEGLIDRYSVARNTVLIVLEWLGRSGKSIQINPGRFPDFISDENGFLTGYEVKFLINPRYSTIREIMKLGEREKIEGRLASFCLILVLQDSDSVLGQMSALGAFVDKMVKETSTDECIIGIIRDGSFRPYYDVTSSSVE